ncbi:MAG: hypothetical protein ABI461_07490 [Polyangiaceae bacterium]
MKMKSLLPMFALVVTFGSTGCAFETGHLHPPSGPVSTTSAEGQLREVLILGPFADERPTQSCGQKKNGWGMDTAPITCSTPPGEWVADALAKGFAANGYIVLPPGTPPRENTYVVRGAVTTFFLSPDTTVHMTTNEMNVATRVEVTVPDGARSERDFRVTGKSLMTLEDNNGFDKAAQSATTQIVNETVDSVSGLLNHPDAAPGWHAPPNVPVMSPPRSATSI